MPLSKYLILMSLSTILCWSAFFIVIYSIDPFQTVTLGFVLFYASLFFALTGTLSLLGFLVRYLFKKNQFINQQVMVSFRQGVLLSLLVVAGLYLQSRELVAWWNLLIMALILIMIEIYFVSQNKNYQAPTASMAPTPKAEELDNQEF